MSANENIGIVRDYLEISWNDRDPSIADHLLAADVTNEGPEFGDQEQAQGREGNKQFVSGMLAAFPDVHCTIDRIEADGDMVRCWQTYRGTHTGSLMGMPPTGRRIEVPVYGDYHLANGQIVHMAINWDPADMMRQLGMG